MTKTKDFEPWTLKWEGEHVKRFWDWQGSNPAKERLYFSNLVGDAILEEIRRYVGLSGTVIDWGAGPGFMVGKLLHRGIDTMAVDSSAASVDLLNERYQGSRHYLGARVSGMDKTAIADEFADAVLLIETIEHLDDQFLSGVLSEIIRVLKPGGMIAVTTPNEEDLDENQVMCPNCGCVFHTVQHVRSLSANSLQERMHIAGFTKLVCQPTLFSWHSPILWPLHRLKYRLKGDRLPHLLYIGRK